MLTTQLDDTPELRPKRFFADDCSSEALTSLMVNNGGTLAVISTEGGIFDLMPGRYSSKVNIDVWLKGHCGDAIYADHSKQFYAFLTMQMPDWKERKTTLDQTAVYWL